MAIFSSCDSLPPNSHELHISVLHNIMNIYVQYVAKIIIMVYCFQNEHKEQGGTHEYTYIENRVSLCSWFSWCVHKNPGISVLYCRHH